jgi:predicted esterase
MKTSQSTTWRHICLVASALASCTRPGATQADAQPLGNTASASFVSPVASRSTSALLTLDVPGFLPASLVVPSGTDARPLVVAAHGAGGEPEWDCEYWARLTEERAFVLCPRGTAMGGGSFYFKHHHALAAEVLAAVAAARRQFPRILPTSGVYAGFSQGASMGALMISKQAKQFPYVVLIEGFTQWNIALGRTFSSGGGQAVLFVCGTGDCASKASASTLALQRVPVRARSEYATGAGHTASGAVMELVVHHLPWLLASDPAWTQAR